MDDPVQHGLQGFAFPDPIPVTRPVLQPLDKYRDLLEGVWSSRLLTNNGNLHQRLETELAQYFEVPHVNLFFNGTIALLVALQTSLLRRHLLHL